MMAPHGYISAAPSPAYPVYYGGVGAVPLGGSVPPVATVPSTWGMHYGPGMAGVEYPAVTTMRGAYPSARPVTTRELTQFPSPGSESVSTTYMPYASRGEFVSLAAGNFGSPYVVPAPTSPPSVTRMSVGSVPGSSYDGVCPSTSSGDSASAHQSSLEDQEVRDQLRQFRHMLEGLERRLDNRLRNSPQPRQPVATPPGFAAFPLAEPHPSLLVETPAAPPVPTESSVQPPAPFTMGQAREQRVAAASGPVTTVTQSAPAVSTVAPVAPLVSTSVVLPSGTATVALPGRPQVPLGRGFLSASRMASAATQAPGESPCRSRLLLRWRHHQQCLATQRHGSRCPTAIERLCSLSSHGVLRLPRCTSTNSPMSPRPGLRSKQSPSLLPLPLPHQLRPWKPRGGSPAS